MADGHSRGERTPPTPETAQARPEALPGQAQPYALAFDRKLAAVDNLLAQCQAEKPSEGTNLYRAYAEHPEAVRAFMFQKGLEKWDLSPDTRAYGQAVLAGERAKEAYLNAQHEWFAKNCGEAYTALKARQAQFEKDIDGLESWKVDMNFHIGESSDPKDWHKVKSSARMIPFSGDAPDGYIDPQALQERQETFRELHPEVFEAESRTKTALLEARAQLQQRIAQDPKLQAELAKIDSSHTFWKQNAFIQSDENFLSSAMVDGLGFSIGKELAKLDAPFAARLEEAQQATRALFESKKNRADQMWRVLSAEQAALSVAGKELEAFGKDEREQALAPLKQEILAAEKKAAECANRDRRGVDLLMWRTGSLLYEHSQSGSDRYLANTTTKSLDERVKDMGRAQPGQYDSVKAEHSADQQRRVQEKQARLKSVTSGLVEMVRGMDLSRLSVDSMSVIKKLKDTLLMDTVQGQLPESFNPLPMGGVSSKIESPLAEAAAISSFGQLFTRLGDRTLDTTLAEGARTCGRDIKALADLLQASPVREIQLVGLSLKTKYASVLQAI